MIRDSHLKWALSNFTQAKTYLFIYQSSSISKLNEYLHSYDHNQDYQKFDHDTFMELPDEIVGINHSYHLKKDAVVIDRDMLGYSSYFFESEQGTEVSAMQNFYMSIYNVVENYNMVDEHKRRIYYYKRKALRSYLAIELFRM